MGQSFIYMLPLLRHLFTLFLFINALPLGAQSGYSKIIREAGASLPAGAEKADSIGRELLREYSQNPPDNDSIVSKTFFLLGQANLYQGKRNLALNYYQKALQTSYAANTPAMADACWNNMATIYERQFRYKEAVEAFHKSLAIAEQLSDSTGIVNTWINIGLLNQRMGSREEAISILTNSCDYLVRHRDTTSLADALINLANAYYPADVVRAEQYYMKALDLCSKVGNIIGTVTLQLNLATLEADRRNFKKSNEILRETVDYCTKNNLNEFLGMAYRIMASNEIDADGDLNIASEYLARSRKLAEASERADLMKLVKEVEIKLRMRMGNYDSFLVTLQDYISFNEDYSQEGAKIINSEFQAIYDVKNITELNQKLEEGMEVKNQQLLFTMLALAGAFIAIIIITFLYFRLRQASRTMYRMNVEIANSVPLAATRIPVSATESTDDAGDETEVPISNLYNIIVSRIENEKMYLDPNLSLGDLCQKINRKQRYVSQAINEVGKTSFSNLINNFRINEARRLLASGKGLTVNEIIEKTGFGSRPAFHRNFKAATGFTPSEYQSRAKNMPETDLDS